MSEAEGSGSITARSYRRIVFFAYPGVIFGIAVLPVNLELRSKIVAYPRRYSDITIERRGGGKHLIYRMAEFLVSKKFPPLFAQFPLG